MTMASNEWRTMTDLAVPAPAGVLQADISVADQAPDVLLLQHLDAKSHSLWCAALSTSRVPVLCCGIHDTRGELPPPTYCTAKGRASSECAWPTCVQWAQSRVCWACQVLNIIMSLPRKFENCCYHGCSGRTCQCFHMLLWTGIGPSPVHLPLPAYLQLRTCLPNSDFVQQTAHEMHSRLAVSARPTN